MENTLNITPRPPRNALQEMAATLEEMTELQKDVTAQLGALRCVVHALCDTHPAPAEALANYLDRMDAMADSLRQQRVAQYGAAMQQFRDTLAAAASRPSR